jgi:hypothetical protein
MVTTVIESVKQVEVDVNMFFMCNYLNCLIRPKVKNFVASATADFELPVSCEKCLGGHHGEYSSISPSTFFSIST